MQKLTLIIDSKPVSVNTAYGTDYIRKRRFLGVRGQALKHAAHYAVYRSYSDVKQFVSDLKPNTPLRFSLRVFKNNIYDRFGNFSKLDASNYIKLIEDAVSEAIGYDDRQHVEVRATKIQSKIQQVVVEIEKL